MTPWIHYKAVLIGRPQKAEIKVHSYSGWTTSRTDIMGSDWKQTTDLNGTEVRNVVEFTVQGKHIPQCIEQALSFDCTRQRRKRKAVSPCMWLDFFPKRIVGCCPSSNEDKHAVKYSGTSLLYGVSLHHNHININTNKEKQLSSSCHILQYEVKHCLLVTQEILDYFSAKALDAKPAYLKQIKNTGVILNMSYLIFWIESYHSRPGWYFQSQHMFSHWNGLYNKC